MQQSLSRSIALPYRAAAALKLTVASVLIASALLSFAQVARADPVVNFDTNCGTNGGSSTWFSAYVHTYHVSGSPACTAGYYLTYAWSENGQPYTGGTGWYSYQPGPYAGGYLHAVTSIFATHNACYASTLNCPTYYGTQSFP